MRLRAPALLMFTLLTALPALVAMSGCAARRPAADSHEIFDEQTGNTLSVVEKPLIFARERSDVAAYARDYATLVAVEVDHSGAFNDYLLLYRWSTVDPRMSPEPDPAQGELRIVTDGRAIILTPLAVMPVDLSRRRILHLPDHGDVIAHAYAVDAATLRFIATSGKISVRMPQEPLDMPFGIWQDGRPALEQFLGRTSAP
jgi:hypothetical protein